MTPIELLGVVLEFALVVVTLSLIATLVYVAFFIKNKERKKR